MLQLQFPFDLQTIAPSLTQFVGFGGITMTTIGGSYGVVPVEDVMSGRAQVIEVTATSDGRSYMRNGGWHTGPEADAVYVEVYSDRGREFHGWIDSVSRKLVQSG